MASGTNSPTYETAVARTGDALVAGKSAVAVAAPLPARSPRPCAILPSRRPRGAGAVRARAVGPVHGGLADRQPVRAGRLGRLRPRTGFSARRWNRPHRDGPGNAALCVAAGRGHGGGRSRGRGRLRRARRRAGTTAHPCAYTFLQYDDRTVAGRGSASSRPDG